MTEGTFTNATYHLVHALHRAGVSFAGDRYPAVIYLDAVDFDRVFLMAEAEDRLVQSGATYTVRNKRAIEFSMNGIRFRSRRGKP